MERKSRKIVLIIALFLGAVILIAVLGHYPVVIMDALTLQAASGFTVHVPAGRILFEPVLGLLLFFNRSLYALTEVPYALAWLFVFYLIRMVWKGAGIREKKVRKAWFGGRVVDIPVVAGGLLTLFVVMIFIRLPGNTIVNKTPDAVLVTTHCHTEYSHDGLISQKSLWRWMKRNGFDAFFITDHNNHNKTLQFVQSQRQGAFPAAPLVMCGEEFSGSNHLSLLGLQVPFTSKGFPDSLAVDTTHARGGAVIVNHWFDGEHMTLEYYRDLGADGFEIENTATDRYYPRNIYPKIRNFCEQNHLIMNGGLDFHGYGNVCSLWNAFDIPGWHKMDPVAKEETILEVLRKRDQSHLKVLLYHDRPYYDKKNLIFRPFITLYNYFRTLGLFQVLSWVGWMLVLTWFLMRHAIRREDEKNIFTGRLISVSGIISALFLLALALNYFLRYRKVTDYNTIYPEYARMFCFIGLGLFIYSLVVFWIRAKKKL